MGCIPVASVEYANSLLVDSWESLEEADEAAFIFELNDRLLEGCKGEVEKESLTFNSGLEAMIDLKLIV